MKTTKNTGKEKVQVKFHGDISMTVGEQIDALVRYFTGTTLGDFMLEQALKKVKENNAKIEAFKADLLSKKEEVQ